MIWILIIKGINVTIRHGYMTMLPFLSTEMFINVQCLPKCRRSIKRDTWPKDQNFNLATCYVFISIRSQLGRVGLGCTPVTAALRKLCLFWNENYFNYFTKFDKN